MIFWNEYGLSERDLINKIVYGILAPGDGACCLQTLKLFTINMRRNLIDNSPCFHFAEKFMTAYCPGEAQSHRVSQVSVSNDILLP